MPRNRFKRTSAWSSILNNRKLRTARRSPSPFDFFGEDAFEGRVTVFHKRERENDTTGKCGYINKLQAQACNVFVKEAARINSRAAALAFDSIRCARSKAAMLRRRSALKRLWLEESCGWILLFFFPPIPSVARVCVFASDVITKFMQMFSVLRTHTRARTQAQLRKQPQMHKRCSASRLPRNTIGYRRTKSRDKARLM